MERQMGNLLWAMVRVYKWKDHIQKERNGSLGTRITTDLICLNMKWYAYLLLKTPSYTTAPKLSSHD